MAITEHEVFWYKTIGCLQCAWWVKNSFRSTTMMHICNYVCSTMFKISCKNLPLWLIDNTTSSLIHKINLLHRHTHQILMPLCFVLVHIQIPIYHMNGKKYHRKGARKSYLSLFHKDKWKPIHCFTTHTIFIFLRFHCLSTKMQKIIFTVHSQSKSGEIRTAGNVPFLYQ